MTLATSYWSSWFCATEFSSLLFAIDSLNPDARMPVGIATTAIPKIAVIPATNLPSVVIGIASPYPTVDIVDTDHHRHLGIDPKTFGCAFPSTRYMMVLLLRSSIPEYTIATCNSCHFDEIA